MITADNITSHPDKVQPFINAITQDKNFWHEIINVPGGILVARKV